MSRKPKLKLSDNPRFKRLAVRYPTLTMYLPIVTIYLLGFWDGRAVHRGFGIALAIVVSMFVVVNVAYWFNSYFRLLISKNPATYWYLRVMQLGRITHDHKYQAQLAMPDNFGDDGDEILVWKIPNTALQLMMARSGEFATLRNTETDQTIMLTSLQALQLSSSLMTATLMLGDEETLFQKAPIDAYDPTIGVRFALWLNRTFTRTKNPEGTK